MRKNKHKKTCEKDKNTSGKWLTDDTVTGESEQTILKNYKRRRRNTIIDNVYI
jgi:hypothetical protein